VTGLAASDISKQHSAFFFFIFERTSGALKITALLFFKMPETTLLTVLYSRGPEFLGYGYGYHI
jgi:hypothetical protein